PAFLLGTANAPILSLSSGLSLVMTPICQPGSRIMPTLPVSNAAASVVSSPSFGALEYLLTVSFSQLRPATDWDESRLPFHLLPSLTARSPPSSQMNGSAPYQY